MVIGGILKCMYSGILLLIKFINLVKSDVEVVLLFSFSRVDTDVKYSFSLFAISRESVICSLSMLSSVGKELVDILGLFAVRRCCQIAFVSLRFVTDSEKCLRLAFRIKFFCHVSVSFVIGPIIFAFAVISIFSGFHNFWRKPVRQTFGFYSSGFDWRMPI